MKRLQKHGMKVNFGKYTFFSDNVDYLAQRIDATGIHPNTEKVHAMMEAPDTQNIA